MGASFLAGPREPSDSHERSWPWPRVRRRSAAGRPEAGLAGVSSSPRRYSLSPSGGERPLAPRSALPAQGCVSPRRLAVSLAHCHPCPPALPALRGCSSTTALFPCSRTEARPHTQHRHGCPHTLARLFTTFCVRDVLRHVRLAHDAASQRPT